MAIELITGRAGAPHIDSADIGAFQADLFGEGRYTFKGVTAELVDANNVHISAGELQCEGRWVRIEGAGEDVTIDNGLSAYKRNDIIAIHYTRDEDGIEDTKLVVIKGEATVDTPTDPAMPTTGKLLEGASDVYWPIFRVTIDGLTPQQPVALAGKQAWYTLGLGEEIPAGADLNDYNEPGIYYFKRENQKQIADMPASIDGTPGTLEVKAVHGVYVRQTLTIEQPYSGEGYQYVRLANSEKGTSDAWKAVGGIDSIVAEGTTSGWYWVKYANGDAFCYARKGFTYSGLWLSNGYVLDSSTGNTWYWPFTFKEKPQMWINPETAQRFANLFTWNDAYQRSATNSGLLRMSLIGTSTSGGGTTEFDVYLYGKWK